MDNKTSGQENNPLILAPAHSEIGEDQDSQALSVYDRISRFASYKQQTAEIVSYLRTLDRQKEADQIAACGSFLKFRKWLNHGKTSLSHGCFCQKDRLCKACAIRRAARLLRVLVTKVYGRLQENAYKAFLVTFTVLNEVELPRTYEKLTKALSGRKSADMGIFFRRARYFDAVRRGARQKTLDKYWTEAVKAEGAFGVIEIKRGAGSGMWHSHMHMVFLCKDGSIPSQEALSQELFRATGYSHQVDVEEFVFSSQQDYTPDGLMYDLCEVCTYVLKLS